jgi:CheY-like chemotaxis protein
VLLVEDSPDDADFARRALARSGVAHRLVVAEHPDRAWALLRGADAEPGVERPLRPALVLLDLNMPGMGGRALLTQIKQDTELCVTPVVVLSTSEHRADIDGCYRAHANGYHVKRDDLAQYQETARCIMHYWLSAVVPPSAVGEAPIDAATASAAR